MKMNKLRIAGILLFAVLLFGCATRGDQVDYNPAGAYNLWGAQGVATADISEQTYLFVTAGISDAVSVFSVADDGSLSFVDDVKNGERGANNLEGACETATAVIGSQTYLFVAAWRDDAVSVFSVADDGRLSFVDDIVDGNIRVNNLDGACRIATAVIGSQTYLFVSAYGDDAVNVFRVADDGILSFVDDIVDEERGAYNLDGAHSVATAIIDGQTYLFVGADRNSDDIKNKAVSVFSVEDDGILSFADDINDGELGADNVEVATAVVAGQTYLFVSVSNDNRVSVFSVADDGSLNYVDYVEDEEPRVNNLRLPINVATTAIGGQTYLFVPAFLDDAVTVFSIASDGSLRFVYDIVDEEHGAHNLGGPVDVATTVIGDRTYLFVAARRNKAVSVFSVSNDGSLTFVDDVKHGEPIL